MKGKQIRRLLAAAGLAGILVMNAGCGSSAGTAGSSAASAESAQVQEASSAVSASEETEVTSSSSGTAAAESTSSGTAAAESTASEIEETEGETVVGMANPWTETEDLEEAAAGSGIRLEAPMEGLPKHGDATMNFWKYLWMDDIIEARYESVNDEMLIRASSGHEKIDLSGDYTEYSKTWAESFKGLEVECMGDGETVNLAYFDEGDTHVSINYNAGEEGRGLTVEELSSLVMGLYAEPAGVAE